MGEDYDDEILKAWGLSKIYCITKLLILSIEENEFPAEFNTQSKTWLFKGAEISENYLSQEQQAQL